MRGRDFPRTFLSLLDVEGQRIAADKLSTLVEAKEAMLEEEFLRGIVAQGMVSHAHRKFSVLVFLVDVKITRKLRFDRWEVIPFRGMDTPESCALANEFLQKNTSLGFAFPYSAEMAETSRQSHPVCVAHFPLILADTMETARDFCRERCFVLGQALAAHRAATAKLISTVVYDRLSDQAKLFSEGTIYRGNLLGGAIAGEDAERIEASIDAMKDSSLMRYFYLLYSYARKEEVQDQKYLKYWQFLEAVSETKNFDETGELRDFQGQPIRSADGVVRKLDSKANQVYEVIRQHKLAGGVGESSVFMSDGKPLRHSLLEMVGHWYAMRNAAAHYGHFLPHDSVQKKKFHYYRKCLKVRKLVDNAGHDYILADLAETASFVLMRETNDQVTHTQVDRTNKN